MKGGEGIGKEGKGGTKEDLFFFFPSISRLSLIPYGSFHCTQLELLFWKILHKNVAWLVQIPRSISVFCTHLTHLTLVLYLRGFPQCFLLCSRKLIGSSPHEVSLRKADYTCWERLEKETCSSALSQCLCLTWEQFPRQERRVWEKRRINWCFHMTEPLTHVDIWQSHEQLTHLTVPWANVCPVACSLSSNFPLFLFSSPFLYGLSFFMAVPLPPSTKATPLSSNWRRDFNHVIIRVGWSQTAKLALSLQLHCDPGESGSTGLVWMSLKTCLTWREMAHFVMIVFLVHKGS